MEEEKFNIGDYVIQFNSVLVVAEISQSFYNFLKEEHNSENWDFILGLQTLEFLTKKKNQKKINSQVLLLVNTFIKPNSTKELQICSNEKKIIIEKTKNLKSKGWNIDESPLELFKDIRMAVIVEYKNDSFKRFIRTQNCAELLEKHSSNRKVLLPRLALVYNYVDEDFERTKINNDDLKFMKEFAQDNPNWKIAVRNKKLKLTIFKSPWNYFPNVKFLKKSASNIKNQFILDYSFQESLMAILKNFDTNTFPDPKIIEYKFGEYCIIQNLPKAIPFFDKRVARTIYQLMYDPELKEVLFLMKPTKIEDCTFLESQMVPIQLKDGKEKKVKAIPYFQFGAAKITEIDEKSTLYEFTSTMDINFNSETPNWFLEYYTTEFLKGIMKNYDSLNGCKKISDFKYDFNDLWQGLPKDPIGKLLYDLDIDGQDKQYSEKMEKRRKVFDISNFIIHFSSLKRKEINENYLEFLKEEHNTDSWDFVLKYNLLKKLNEKSKYKQENDLLNEIIETFIETKSSKDLCLDPKKIEEIKEKVKNKTKNYPSFKYFQSIYQEIKMEHQLDSFKRFVTLPKMIDVLAKYQHDVDVMSPILEVLSTYENGDFESLKIESKDLNFISSLTKNSSTWFYS